MCKVMDDYAKSEKIDLLKKMFANGLPLEVAVKSVEELSREAIVKLFEEVTGKTADL